MFSVCLQIVDGVLFINGHISFIFWQLGLTTLEESENFIVQK